MFLCFVVSQNSGWYVDLGCLLADQIVQHTVRISDFFERFQNSGGYVEFGRLLVDQIMQHTGNLGGHQIACYVKAHFGSWPPGPLCFGTRRWRQSREQHFLMFFGKVRRA